ncbi:hypothetical protein DLD99_14390 [Pseudomonas kribbensis]|uniref:Uncharacterized protein n=1 Tax=Pseudomonas kribbensis TaxID=1628086 RepID=A0A345RQP6_9PSED|nr:hypothetical protein [Pseudomonas kribbensis]AXI61612.1 hypothetical protein DLD99_14390 [Pseudomonas kribbensis]
MLDGKAAATYLLSAAALLGPLAYILFAFHEMGRLEYFDAPIDFLQMSSFGILPVVTTVYPGILCTFLVVGLLSGVRFARGGQRQVLIIAACTYVSMILYYLSLTLIWQLVFGIASVIGASAAIFMNRHMPDIGNEEMDPEKDPQSKELKHYSTMKNFALIFAGAGVFVLFFQLLEKKMLLSKSNIGCSAVRWCLASMVILRWWRRETILRLVQNFVS